MYALQRYQSAALGDCLSLPEEVLVQRDAE